MRATEINLPPWVGLVLNGVRHAFAVVAVLVAIHRSARVTAVSRRRLRGLATLRNVFATAQDLDLSDLEAFLFTRNLDADEAGWFAGRDGGLGFRGSCGGFFLDLLLWLLCVVVRRDRAFKAGIHLRFDPTCKSAASEGVGFGGTDEGDVEVSFDLLFQPERPEDAVHEQATVAFVRDVFGGSIERGENAAFLAGRGFVNARPLAGHRRLRRIGR